MGPITCKSLLGETAEYRLTSEELRIACDCESLAQFACISGWFLRLLCTRYLDVPIYKYIIDKGFLMGEASRHVGENTI